MKKIIIIALCLLIFQQRDAIGDLIWPPKVYSHLTQRVTLYSTEWCGYCDRARRFFVRHKVPFDEYDIEKSDSALSQYRAYGVNSVPLIIVGDTVLSGFQRNHIEVALEQLND